MDDSNYFKKWFVLDDVPFWNLLQETGAGLEEFVYGEFGLGALLLEEGNDALPSPKYQDKWPTHEGTGNSRSYPTFQVGHKKATIIKILVFRDDSDVIGATLI